MKFRSTVTALLAIVGSLRAARAETAKRARAAAASRCNSLQDKAIASKRKLDRLQLMQALNAQPGVS